MFAVIAAIAMTTIGLSGDSTTALMVSSPSSQSEGVGMLGHIQYTLTDSNNQVVKYVQGDAVFPNMTS